MDLASTFNAPRLCWLGERPFWIRALSLESWAIIAAFLDDHVAREDMQAQPATSDEAARALLDSKPGQHLMCWLGLREYGITLEAASALWDEADDQQRQIFIYTLRRRRRTFSPDADDSGTNIAQYWCGKGIANLVAELGFAEVSKLSLDQLDWLSEGGEADSEHDPSNLAWKRWMGTVADRQERMKQRMIAEFGMTAAEVDQLVFEAVKLGAMDSRARLDELVAKINAIDQEKN